MKEILADNLAALFENTSLKGTNTYKGDRYEVWEVSDEDLKIMSDMTDKDFEKCCPNGWWRYSEGSLLGTPDKKYMINGEELIAWDGKERETYFDDFCKECSDHKYEMCDGNKEDILECCGKRKYESISDYLCTEIGASTEKNVCACAMDLAKYNGMTMAELFRKYEE